MPRFSLWKRHQLDEALARRVAFAFTVFLLFFEMYVVGVGYSAHLIGVLDTDSGLFFAFTLAFLVASVFLVYRFTYSALAAPWPHRGVYLLIVSLAAAAEYSYQKALGRFSEIIDVELAVATTFEQKAASFAMYFGLSAVVPVAVFALLLFFTQGWRERASRDLLAVNAMIVGVLLAGSVLSLPRFPTLSTYAFYRTNVEFLLFGPISNGKWASGFTGIKLQRMAVTPPPDSIDRKPENNIILVIDESVRGDHFSLNGYHRPTTPFLDKLRSRGILQNWGIAASASTGSQTTYNAVVTGLTPDDFPDPGNVKLNTTPSIFQYAKAMGYTTWFFDGQMNTFWGGIEDDKRFIDHWAGSTDLADPSKWGKWDVDIEIARRINVILKGSKGNFIFVFKYGSHIPYHFNFPPDQAVWQPSYLTHNRFDIPGPDRLHEVVNAYDNSIRYNVNSFFENLVDDYAAIPNNSVILYTGDHGQTLYENGRASHGGSTPDEARVPLFIIGDAAGSADTRYKASHCSIFPTLLDLMEFPANAGRKAGCPSLLEAKAADSRQRYFNPMLGPKVAFD
jgi:glucan phosphoethanolaminetransferase (alkaline phosphatase superfamily)